MLTQENELTNIKESQTQQRVRGEQEVPQEVSQEEEEEATRVEEVKDIGETITEILTPIKKKYTMNITLIMGNTRVMTGNLNLQG